MSTAAEVRAASTAAATSSNDRKPSAASSVQGVRHPVAKDGHSLNKDRQPVAKNGHPAKDRVEKIEGRASPKPDEKPIQRRTSEVDLLPTFSFCLSFFGQGIKITFIVMQHRVPIGLWFMVNDSSFTLFTANG